MNVVVYTEDMEPITVVDIPQWAWDRLARGERINLTVREPISLYWNKPLDSIPELPKMVSIWGEVFIRRGNRTLFVFTRDDENALALKSEFLPGQRSTLQERERQARAAGMLHGLIAGLNSSGG